MTFLTTGQAAMRRASLVLGLLALAAALSLAPFASAKAATTTKLYAGSVVLGAQSYTIVQLQPGDIVKGTVTFDMDPIPPDPWLWFGVVAMPGFSASATTGGAPIQFNVTIAQSGAFFIGSIGTGSAHYLFTVTRQSKSMPPVVGPPAGGATRR